MKKRVLLADDHKPFREAVCAMLEREPGIEVVGAAGDGIEVLELVRSARPDVVVMDIHMPRLNGIEAIRQAAAACPSVKVIVFSVTSERFFASEMLGAGASGYVTKGDAHELPRAIHAVMSGINYLSQEVGGTGTDPLHTGRLVDGAT